MSAAAEALAADPRLLRRAAWFHGPLALLLLLAAIGLPACFALRWPERVLDPPYSGFMPPLLAFMSANLLAGAFVMWRMGAWLREQRLLATPTHLVFMAPRWSGLKSSREARAPWPEVFFDGSRLLAGAHLLTLRLPLGRIFDAEALDRLLAGRLPRSQRLEPAALTRRAWRAGAYRTQVRVAAACLALTLAAIVAMKLIIAPHLSVPP